MNKFGTIGLFIVSVGWSLAAMAADFSRCQIYPPNLQLAYGIGIDGKLKHPKKDPDLISYSNENGNEVAVVKTKPNLLNNKKITYSLHGEDGKPVSYSEEIGTYKATYAFGYDGDKCYVAESSIKSVDPRTRKPFEQVSYNKDMCDQVLQVAGRLDNGKLQECGAIFSSVEYVRNQFQSKFAAQGRGMVSPMAGFLIPSEATPASASVPTAMDLVYGCKGARYFYPVDGIKAPTLKDGGAFPGGSGGGFVGAPATDVK